MVVETATPQADPWGPYVLNEWMAVLNREVEERMDKKKRARGRKLGKRDKKGNK